MVYVKKTVRQVRFTIIPIFTLITVYTGINGMVFCLNIDLKKENVDRSNHFVNDEVRAGFPMLGHTTLVVINQSSCGFPQ